MARRIGDAFHRSGTLRRIRWPFGPGPTTALTAFADGRDRWMTFSRHPGSSPVLHRFSTVQSDSRLLLHATRSPTFHRRRPLRARPPFTPAGPLFERPDRERIWGRRRLPISATALRRAGTSPSSRHSRRDGGRNLLPFLTCHAAFLSEAVVTRRVALRPLVGTPVPVPPAFAGLPDRDTPSSAPPNTAHAVSVE